MSDTRKRAKLAHVAVHSGVSLGTASDALRGKGRMSDETRQRVLDSAKALGYRSSAQARTLATGHSYIVGLVVHEHSTTAGPRLYWPRLQAEFTERLIEHRLVACTMTLADLNRLDGLPFDLIVFAHLQLGDTLPTEVRSNYQVMDIDLTGDTADANSLRVQFERLCSQSFDQLAKLGAQHPALVLPPDMTAGHPAAVAFTRWCATRECEAVIVEAQADELPDLSPSIDGIFSILVNPDWLVHSLSALGFAVDSLPLICLGPEPQSANTAATVGRLTLDGASVGRQMADSAAALIYDRQPERLQLAWLLDGQPFPVQ